MQDFLSTTLGIIISIGGVFGVVAIGGLYLAGVWKGKKDNEDDRLIDILKSTVDALEVKVNNQKIESAETKKEHEELVDALSLKIDDLTTKVGKLERENELLVKVLQGRDEQTKEFYKKAFEAIEIAKSTHGLVIEMSKNQTKLMETLVKYLNPKN